MASAFDDSIAPLFPTYSPSKPALDRETPKVRAVIERLNLQPHVEGGYFVETDRDPRRVADPFAPAIAHKNVNPLYHPSDVKLLDDMVVNFRAASTTIHYLLTPGSSLGAFHRNRGRTVHTLHRGRARYVIIHADEVAAVDRPQGYNASDKLDKSDEGLDEKDLWTGKARVETFIVGRDVLAGERPQWIVEGGKYKASFLLGTEVGEDQEGCLISETVVPGCEYVDHDFMTEKRAEVLLTPEQMEEGGWMLRKD